MLPFFVYMKALFVGFLFLLQVQYAQAQTLRFLQFNIWQEGTVVPDGFNAIVDEIIANKADIITFSEVRNYKNTRFNERIVTALKNKGFTYYVEYSYDSGILSKYPIQEFATIFPNKDDHGSSYKAIIQVDGKEIAVYTAHLDYLNAANYLTRGYDANSWKKLTAKSTSVSDILTVNLESKRDEAISGIIADAQKETAKGRFVFLGVDFNEPSFRDWKKDTRNLFDHNGLVIPWQNSLSLEKAGFVDAYRTLYPNVVTHPGFTFPAYNPHVDIGKLIWAPDADDRERIDFVYFMANKKLRLESVSIVGPSSSIVYGKPLEEKTLDPFIAPVGIWPTDHKAILATFTFK